MDEVMAMGVAVDSLLIFTKAEEYRNAQAQFLKARFAYKKIESLTEFYFSGISKAINGPAIDKAEEYDDKVVVATGFQVVEEYLFPIIDESNLAAAVQEIEILKSCVVRIRALMEGNEFTDPNIFQAARLELLRIMSLGISGFDSPIALLSLYETNAALSGLRQILSFYRDETNKESWKKTDDAFAKAVNYLDRNTDFNSFDRAEFIVQFLNPLTRQVYDFQVKTGIKNNKWKEAVDLAKKDFFQQGVFNVDYFARQRPAGDSIYLIELGRVLFFDPILSGNNRRACASCHQPGRAFTDGNEKSVAFNFVGAIPRNASTLINAGYQKSQFWDQRVQFLEDQVSDVAANPLEMHRELDQSVMDLNASDGYRKLFSNAFSTEPLDTITPLKVRVALAAYVRSLDGLDSKFDRYFRDGSEMLSREELSGFNLFMGKAKCGTCHFLPIFNGSVPPLYYETESEVIGVPLQADTADAQIDNDLGKFHTYNRELHKNAFKTPTVRNAALTAPFMHNGVYETLEEVVDFYNRGGGQGIGIELPNQTLPPEKLNLSKSEQHDIVSFIHTLSDTVGLTTRPRQLPTLNNPVLDRRRIGGEY